MEVGATFSGRYRLVRALASGGMGEVWAVRNVLTQRDFAIKFLLPELLLNPEAFDRFVREAETTGKLQHPSIVDVFDVAQTDEGCPYIVMELLKGEELDTKLAQDGTLAPLRVAEYFSQVAGALALAHEAGVVHRDLSSANVFLAKDAETGQVVPKILDFGVSKIVGPDYAGDSERVRTGNGAVLGSPSYMSPEQACGAETVDARTDVWSLGILMYQCLSGTCPFRASNYNALMTAIMLRPHRPLAELVPAVDRELISLVEQCLLKDRELRVQSAREVSERLAHIARRLATEPGDLSCAPRRRMTDRLLVRHSDRRVPPAALARVPRRGLFGVLRAHVLAAAILGGILGTGLGFVLGRQTRVSSAQVVQSAQQPAHIDLSRAVARGLRQER